MSSRSTTRDRPALSGRVDFALSDDKGNTDKNEIDFGYKV
jgi:hypothetical protein